MKKYFLSILLLTVINFFLNVVTGQKDSSIVILPESRISPVIFLDPLECQIMGGSYLLFQENKDLSLYSTVNLGFSEPVVGKVGSKISWELNFGTAIFSQFDLIRKDDGTYLAGLMNNDFKLSGDLTVKKKNDLLRLRLFHISSHLGDDFMLRQPDTLLNDKSVNYEQADLTYMRIYRDNYFYVGAGAIYTKYVFRERFSVQGGGVFNFGKPGNVRYFTALDIKSLAENGWYPDIRTALGINVTRHVEPLVRIWLEYYTGRLPYSTIDYGRVDWLGLAMTLNFFR